jgi:hypothetical protein
VEKKRKRDAYLANAIKRKKEREEKFRKQDEEEAKKKEQEEALKKQKDYAAPTQTRPVQKAASRSNPPAEPPKKKIQAVTIASRLPIEPPAASAKELPEEPKKPKKRQHQNSHSAKRGWTQATRTHCPDF